MDLSNYDLTADAEKGFTINVYDPVTLEPSDIDIDIIGAESTAYRVAKSNGLRDVAKRTQNGENVDTDIEEAKIYATCITGWKNLALDGAELEFTLENATKVLIRFAWLRDQVAAAVEKRANFTKLPARS